MSMSDIKIAQARALIKEGHEVLSRIEIELDFIASTLNKERIAKAA